MKQFKVGFDLDDVVFDFNGGFLEIYNKKFNDNKTLNDFKLWDMHKYLKANREQIKELFQTKGLYENLKPFPYMIQLIKALKKSNIYEPFFISASPEGCYDAKVVSIRKNFPFLNKENVIFAHDKSAIDVHIIFDDGPHNIQGVMENRKGLTAPVIVEKPWNVDFRMLYFYELCAAKNSANIVYFMYCVDNYLRELYNLMDKENEEEDFKWMHYYLMKDIRKCKVKGDEALFKFYAENYKQKNIPIDEMLSQIGQWEMR